MRHKHVSPFLGIGMLLLISALTLIVSRNMPELVKTYTAPIVHAIKDPAPLRAKALLTSQQSALVQHLSSKYRQPADLVERIVLTSYREASRVGLPPTLILAVIEKESSLNPLAKSGYGAMGLMQVVPRFHMEKLPEGAKPDVLEKPEANIRVGADILAEYRGHTKGSIPAALKKYSGSAKGYAEKVAFFKRELELVANSAPGAV